MSTRRIRFDRLAPLSIVTELGDAPTPTRTPAALTVEGYLEADALLARDGLLRYSDATGSWLEHRPRDELDRAAATWAHAPITDDHPPEMVSASTHSAVARGVVLGTPTVIELDGVGYLRARVRITDASLVARVLAGHDQLSIGFLASVETTPGTHDGQRYDAVQRELAGNHVAVVALGRAGPACRILDSATCYATPIVRTPIKPTAKIASAPKGDEAGSPSTVATVTGPEGTEVEVPSWVAAAVEYAMSNGWMGMGAKSEPEPEAAPEMPSADSPLPTDPEKDPMMRPDAVSKLVARAKADALAEVSALSQLQRRADRAGIPASKVDALDYTGLAREYVSKLCPHLKAIADTATGAALTLLVEAAHATPAQPVVANPFERRQPVADAASDPEVMAHANFLTRMGFSR